MRNNNRNTGRKSNSKQSTSKKRRANRDIQKGYPLPQFIEKLRRFADALETGKRFSIQIHHERIHVPARAVANIEHERDGSEEEIEFQLKWRIPSDATPSKAKAKSRANGKGKTTDKAKTKTKPRPKARAR